MRLFFMSFKLVWVLSLSAPDFNTLYVFRPRRWSQFEYFVTGVIINTMHVPGADQPFWRGRWRLWPQLHHWQERNTLFIVTFKNIAKLPWYCSSELSLSLTTITKAVTKTLEISPQKRSDQLHWGGRGRRWRGAWRPVRGRPPHLPPPHRRVLQDSRAPSRLSHGRGEGAADEGGHGPARGGGRGANHGNPRWGLEGDDWYQPKLKGGMICTFIQKHIFRSWLQFGTRISRDMGWVRSVLW